MKKHLLKLWGVFMVGTPLGMATHPEAIQEANHWIQSVEMALQEELPAEFAHYRQLPPQEALEHLQEIFRIYHPLVFSETDMIEAFCQRALEKGVDLKCSLR